MATLRVLYSCHLCGVDRQVVEVEERGPDEDVIEDLRMALDAPEGSPRTSHAVTASS